MLRDIAVFPPNLMSEKLLGKPRPLWQVILLSAASLLLYYGYYKWVIQDELRRYNGSGWSGALCLIPFVLGNCRSPSPADWQVRQERSAGFRSLGLPGFTSSSSASTEP